MGSYKVNLTEVSEVKMEVKMEVNSLRSWELKWTIVNETASIQSYRPARSALLPASDAGFTPYLTPFYIFRNLNKSQKNARTASFYVHIWVI